MSELDLSWNNITATLPSSWLAATSPLVFINLAANKLYGTIPAGAVLEWAGAGCLAEV